MTILLYSIDATAEIPFHLGRLINHSKSGNLKPTVKVDVRGEPQIIFQALKDIAVGQELLYNYKEKRAAVLKDNPWLS